MKSAQFKIVVQGKVQAQMQGKAQAQAQAQAQVQAQVQAPAQALQLAVAGAAATGAGVIVTEAVMQQEWVNDDKCWCQPGFHFAKELPWEFLIPFLFGLLGGNGLVSQEAPARSWSVVQSVHLSARV